MVSNERINSKTREWVNELFKSMVGQQCLERELSDSQNFPKKYEITYMEKFEPMATQL